MSNPFSFFFTEQEWVNVCRRKKRRRSKCQMKPKVNTIKTFELNTYASFYYSCSCKYAEIRNRFSSTIVNGYVITYIVIIGGRENANGR